MFNNYMKHMYRVHAFTSWAYTWWSYCTNSTWNSFIL